MRWSCSLALCTLWLLASNAHSQQLDCSKDLVKDTTHFVGDWSREYAFFHWVKEDNWKELQRNGQLDTIIKGKEFGADYSEMKKAVNSRASLLKYSLSEREAVSLLTSKLGDNGLAAYRECLRIRSKEELEVFVREASANLIVLEGYWKPSEPAAAAFEGFSIEPVPSKVVMIGDKIPRPARGEPFFVRFTRLNPHEEVSIVVKAKFKLGNRPEYSREVRVPPYVDLVIEPETVVRSKNLEHYQAVSGSTIGYVPFGVSRTSNEWWIVPGAVGYVLNRYVGRIKGFDVEGVQNGQPKFSPEYAAHSFSGRVTVHHYEAYNNEGADFVLTWTEARGRVLRNGRLIGYVPCPNAKYSLCL